MAGVEVESRKLNRNPRFRFATHQTEHTGGVVAHTVALQLQEICFCLNLNRTEDIPK